jgi:hypothetical protein
LDCLNVFNSLEGFETRIVVRKGRFSEEVNYEVYVGRGEAWVRLLAVKMFNGRPPFYRRWVELFHILPEVSFKGLKYVFLNSPQERELVKCLSSQLSGGEKIFIEYIYDDETYKALEAGIPTPLTRLGYMLLENGFTWFKNWYFAEGFMEGSPKIQGEKPLDENHRMRLLREICGEVEDFLKTVGNSVQSKTRDYYTRAVERALKIRRDCAGQ